MKRLMDTHHFDLPNPIDTELEAIVRQHMQHQQQRKGGARNRLARGTRKPSQEHRDEAARRVKVSLVLETIAEKEGLTVTQDDLRRNHEAGVGAQMPAADSSR